GGVAGRVALARRQAERGQGLAGARAALRSAGGTAVGVEQRQRDVLERAGAREEVEALEHEADALAADLRKLGLGPIGDVDALEQIAPPVGRSRQPRMFIRVDLPDPDAPIRARNSPSSTRRSTPASACTSTSPR